MSYSRINNFTIPQNIVRDWNKAQGITHPTDLSIQIYRDYNIRHVSVQNSATRPVGIAVTAYASGPIPSILKVMNAGELLELGINSQGQAPQYLWLLDVETGKPLGKPDLFERIANDFVIRAGLNKWYVSHFIRPSYSPAS